MTSAAPPPAADLNDEVAALIASLRRTEQRLEELTAGEVDAVADRDGWTYLLQHAQERLRQSDAARQTAILDALPAHIALLDGQGIIVSVNEAWQRFGRANAVHSAGHVIGVDYLAVCDRARGDDATEASQAAAGIRAVLDGKVSTFTLEYPCHSPAKQRWFLMTVTPLAGDTSKGAVVMHLDVTARKQAEEQIRGLAARLTTTLESITDAFFTVDRQWRFTFLNREAERLLGRTRAELIGRDFWTEFPDTVNSPFEREYRRAIEQNEAVVFEEFYQPLDTWFSVRAYPSEQGLAVYFRDVTEHRQAEDKLRESERRFSDLLANVELVSVMLDRDARITYCNDYLLRLTGWRSKEVVGRNWFELFIPPELADMKGSFFTALLADQPELRHYENEILTRAGERRLIRWNNSVLWSATGDAVGIAGIGEDITERKTADARIVYLNRVYAMLSGINTLIVRGPNHDALYKEACRIAVEAGGFRMAMLVILDRSAAKLVVAASAGKDEELINDIKAILSSDELAPRTMVARAIKEKRIIISNNSESDPQVVFGPKYVAAGVRSMIVLPLMLGQEATGALALYAGEKEFFHAEETQLLTELAGDIAFALDNIDKQQKLANLARVRTLSGKISAAIIRIHDREQLLRETCRIAVDSGGFRLAWAAVVDRSAMTLMPLTCEGAEQRFLEQIPLSLDPADGKKFGLVGLVVREKRPIVVDDMQHDPRIVRRVEAGQRGLHSLVTLPLLVADTVVAVLALYTKEVGFFDASEMELLLELTGNISFALDNIAKAEEINYFAFYDALTGLANRALFLERLEQYRRSAVAGKHKLAVFLIDLERFKNINDSLGRPAGDVLLQQVAEWLKERLGDANLLARVGPDQFVTVLPHVEQDGDLGRLLEKWMQSLLEHPFHLRDAVFRIAVKVGVALFPDDGGDAETLYRNAEVALKRAKASGDRYLFYTRQMTASVADKLTLENQLREAHDKGQFELYYQPKLSLAGGKLTGAEALIRWNDPRTGLVPPGRFIPVLEETGLIYEVGRWALRQAVTDNLHWRASGLPAARIAVNVSPLQLRARGFIDEIRQTIAVDPQAAAGLELEITESLIMANIKLSIACLQAIRDLGVRIAIDDFGTGFSSLSYLARLPVDTLKIDRSFIIDMTSGAQGLALVGTIINLAHSLKLTVVAEGVETEEQSRLLRLLDCDEMQGFLFSKPVPREDFETRFLAPPAAG